MSENVYILYGVQFSYYVGKVRSYLRKKRIEFEERLTNHPHFFDVIVPKAGFNTMPIIETPDGEVVQDTTEIIDFLESRHPERSVYPSGAKQRLVALIFELYGDEGLLKAGLHYRWSFPKENHKWIVNELSVCMAHADRRFFDHSADTTAIEQAEAAAKFMPVEIKNLGVDESTRPAIEASYEEFLDLFELHCQHYPYLLGGRPSIGDFGLMAPLYAHLGRDPYPADLMKQRAPSVYRWVERMNAADSGMAEFPDIPHDYLSNDAIPDTLLPILTLIANDYMPELESILGFMDGWVKSHPDFPSGTPINPAGVLLLGAQSPLGTHTVTMRGLPITQNVRYYSQWMFQRVLDHYASLNESERTDLAALLEPTGLLPYLHMTIPRRMERVNNKEVFA